VLQRDRERLAALAARGVLLQVTAGTLASGRLRSRSRRLARALVSEGLAHVLASDAHAADGDRRPSLSAGAAAADALAPGSGEWMAREVPAAVLAGGPVPERPLSSRRRRAGWRRR
jgi:protein-tyrosine phosphatase